MKVQLRSFIFLSSKFPNSSFPISQLSNVLTNHGECNCLQVKMNEREQPLQHLIIESEGNNYVLENVSLKKKGNSYLSHWKINKKQPFQYTNLDASSFQTTPTVKKERTRKKSEKKETSPELQNSPQYRRKRSIIDTHDPHEE
jgi:hypothetical protein